MAKKVKNVPNVLTDEERKILVKSIQRAWDEIACDIFEIEDCPDPMPRDEVFDVATDADRPVTNGGCPQAIYDKFVSIPYKAQEIEDIMIEAFPHEYYGS